VIGLTLQNKYVGPLDIAREYAYLIVVKTTNKMRKASPMKKSFTVLYKNVDKFQPADGKSQDMSVYTFHTDAVDSNDAVRLFKASRMYSVGGRTHYKRFRILRAFTGDGVGFCDCAYCRKNPSMSRKVRVLKSRQPKWMTRSFTSNAR
jgi:hypothetical protein